MKKILVINLTLMLLSGIAFADISSVICKKVDFEIVMLAKTIEFGADLDSGKSHPDTGTYIYNGGLYLSGSYIIRNTRKDEIIEKGIFYASSIPKSWYGGYFEATLHNSSKNMKRFIISKNGTNRNGTDLGPPIGYYKNSKNNQFVCSGPLLGVVIGSGFGFVYGR